MIRSGATFVLLVGLMASANGAAQLGCAFGAELNPQQAEAPVYRNGEAWKYRALTKFFGGSTSKSLLNGEYKITFEGGGRKTFWLDGNKEVEETNPGALSIMLPIKALVNHTSGYFRVPLVVGNKWKSEYSSQAYGRTIKPEMSVVGIENVITPAGEFSAYRIQRTFSHTKPYTGAGDVYQIEVKEIYLYSPQARSVVNYHYQLEWRLNTGSPFLDSTVDIELISHRQRRSVKTDAE